AALSTAPATTLAGGAATFSGLAISGTAGDYTLRFESGSLAPATSGTITLSAGTATQLTITTQPSATAGSGAAFGQQPVIQVRDGAGNPAGGGAGEGRVGNVTGGGAVGGTATSTTNSSGVASFTNLSISGTAGGYPLSFSATGLTTATSGTITLSAGPAAQLTITTQPSPTATSGAAFTSQPVLQVRDGAGNPASGAGVSVTAVIASGPASATLSNATATTVGSGAATFSGLAINGAAGDYTLRFE